jgi:hypothetical protein
MLRTLDQPNDEQGRLVFKESIRLTENVHEELAQRTSVTDVAIDRIHVVYQLLDFLGTQYIEISSTRSKQIFRIASLALLTVREMESLQRQSGESGSTDPPFSRRTELASSVFRRLGLEPPYKRQ